MLAPAVFSVLFTSALGSVQYAMADRTSPWSTSPWSRLEKGDWIKKTCEMTCNGETLPCEIDAASWPQFECWGDFQLKWQGETEGTVVDQNVMCTGAFRSIRVAKGTSTSDLPEAAHALAGDVLGKSGLLSTEAVSFTACEGDTVFLSKVVSSEKGPREVTRELEGNRGQEIESKAGTTAVIEAMICGGDFKELDIGTGTLPARGGHTCDERLISGQWFKQFPQGMASSDIMHDLERAQRFIEQHAHHHTSHHKSHHRRQGDTAGTSGDTFVARAWPETQDSLLERAKSRESSATCGPGAAQDGKCELLCNGKPAAWGGWWPCWGHTEYKCGGDADNPKGGSKCFSIKLECNGFSWPAMMTCHGTFVSKFQDSHKDKGKGKTDKSFKLETLDITSGCRKMRTVKKDGWIGEMQIGHGHNSVRYAVEAAVETPEKGAAKVGDIGQSAEEQLSMAE